MSFLGNKRYYFAKKSTTHRQKTFLSPINSIIFHHTLSLFGGPILSPISALATTEAVASISGRKPFEAEGCRPPALEDSSRLFFSARKWN